MYHTSHHNCENKKDPGVTEVVKVCNLAIINSTVFLGLPLLFCPFHFPHGLSPTSTSFLWP